MNNGLDQRKALVTGGTRGIGAAIAQSLVQSGCDVVVTGRTQREGWWSDEPHCYLRAVDFSDISQLDEFCNWVGDYSPEILINNSGTFYTAAICDVDVAQWNHLMDVNLTAPMRLMKAACGGMRARRWGRVVNVGSIAGIVTRTGLGTYSATKAALSSLTRSVALDLAPEGVLVNCVCPAYTETDMLSGLTDEQRDALLAKVPLGKFGQPEDVAELVAFLSSDKNQFITGQSIIIDGGVTIQ